MNNFNELICMQPVFDTAWNVSLSILCVIYSLEENLAFIVIFIFKSDKDL